MKTLEEFRKFYDTTLLHDLRSLEQDRRRLARNLAIAAAIILLPLLILALTLLRQAGPAAAFPLIAALIIFGFVAYFLSRTFTIQFKQSVITPIVHFVDPNLIYRPTDRIPKTLFIASKIFTTEPNRYKGDDRVSGRVGETAVDFSEVKAERETGSGKNRRRYTIFKGLFFIADFNKNFLGRTLVLPDTAEKLFGHVGQMMQSWNLTRDDLVKLEDPEFEQLFVVYSTDQIEARYILSTSLMARIVDFRKKTGRDIYISFLNSSVVVAIPYDRQLFEPKLFTTLLDYDVICEYFDDIRLAVGIVEDLNLNTRIWSKQIQA